MKFLIIRFSSIGDIVLTTPAIRCLKKQVAGAEIHFVTKLSMKAVTSDNPYIDKFHYLDQNLEVLIGQLKKEQFDYVIDLHKNFRSYSIRWALQTKTLSYRKLTLQKFLLTQLGINAMPGVHVSQRFIQALKPLNVYDDGDGLDYFIPQNERIKDTDLPASHLFGFVAVVIGGTYYTKKLPVHKLQQLCSLIQFPLVLVGGKEDVEDGEAVAAVDNVKIYNACGKFSLNESADIVRRAKCVISHDTGLQHIACAYQKPVIAIWGGTSPRLGMEPYYGTKHRSLHKNFIVEGLRCQPCSNNGIKKCPLGHFKCMELQDIGEMAKIISGLLK